MKFSKGFGLRYVKMQHENSTVLFNSVLTIYSNGILPKPVSNINHLFYVTIYLNLSSSIKHVINRM